MFEYDVWIWCMKIIHEHDVLVRSTVFRNSSLEAHYNNPAANKRKPHPMISRLHRAMSTTVDFENATFLNPDPASKII